MRKQPRESRRGTNVATGNANAGPGGDTATVAQSKARAEHGRGPGATRRLARRAAARQSAQAGSSKAEGQDARGVRVNGVVSTAERGSGSGLRDTARWQADRGGDHAQRSARWCARFLKQLEIAYAMSQTLS